MKVGRFVADEYFVCEGRGRGFELDYLEEGSGAFLDCGNSH